MSKKYWKGIVENLKRRKNNLDLKKIRKEKNSFDCEFGKDAVFNGF